MMISKIWLILMLCTFASSEEQADYRLTVKDDGKEMTYEVSHIGNKCWNIYLPHPKDESRNIPMNFRITEEGEFQTVLMGDILNVKEFFKLADDLSDYEQGIDWALKNEVKYISSTDPEASKIKLQKKGNKVTITQENGYVGEAKSIVLEWSKDQD